MIKFLPEYLTEIARHIPAMSVYLDQLNADVLKRIARIWVGTDVAKLNKENARKLVEEKLTDPDGQIKLQRFIQDDLRDGLALIRLRGGRAAYTVELGLELLYLRPYTGDLGKNSYHNRHEAVSHRVNELLGFGLIVQGNGRPDVISAYTYDAPEIVGTIPELMQGMKLSRLPRPDIKPAVYDGPVLRPRPGELMLRMVSLRETLGRLGTIELKGMGQYPKTTLTKLSRSLGWQAGPQDPLPNPVLFFLDLWGAAGLLRRELHSVKLHTIVTQGGILDEPARDLAVMWAMAWRSQRRWHELSALGYGAEPSSSLFPSNANGLRAALLLALAMLPAQNEWYGVADLSNILCTRLGALFGLAGSFSYHPAMDARNESDDPALGFRDRWWRKRRESWRKLELIWIQRAMCGPLFHLGLVELSAGDDPLQPEYFRLTDTGRYAVNTLYGQATVATAALETRPAGPCWIVQPNFDALVYLDRASPRELGLMERIATRTAVTDVTATYKISRETIYGALESGLTIEGILADLNKSAQFPLTDSTTRVLTDWSRRRDRLSLRTGASVLEFADATQRDETLAEFQDVGRAIGERFILVENKARARQIPLAGEISYEPEPPRCLTVSENGIAQIHPARRDLLIAAELAAYCERGVLPDVPANHVWVITAKSAAAASERGMAATDVLDHLTRRATHKLPAILPYILQAWMGPAKKAPRMTVPSPPLLQTDSIGLADAIHHGKLIRRYLLGRIGPCAFLVRPEYKDELEALLLKYGFGASAEVLVPPPAKGEEQA
ncbi:MAG: hypothetical protein ACKV2V_16150 [Blastocatellia bacterium]